MIYRRVLGNICVALIPRPIAKVKKLVFVMATVYLVVFCHCLHMHIFIDLL